MSTRTAQSSVSVLFGDGLVHGTWYAAMSISDGVIFVSLPEQGPIARVSMQHHHHPIGPPVIEESTQGSCVLPLS